MKLNKERNDMNTCSQCAYMEELNSEYGSCHAVPPVIVDKLIGNTESDVEFEVRWATRYPAVSLGDIACSMYKVR